jgi:hypothetical protein
MLSTQYRIRLEEICRKMIWAEKLAKANRSAATMMRQARRTAENPNMPDDGMDDFLNRLDIGGLGHERLGRRGFSSPDDMAEWFQRNESDNWRQRD